MKPQIKYDSDSKIVSIRVSNERSVDSEIKDNVVVDYDSDGNIVNIDVMKIGIGEFSKIRKVIPSPDLARA